MYLSKKKKRNKGGGLELTTTPTCAVRNECGRKDHGYRHLECRVLSKSTPPQRGPKQAVVLRRSAPWVVMTRRVIASDYLQAKCGWCRFFFPSGVNY